VHSYHAMRVLWIAREQRLYQTLFDTVDDHDHQQWLDEQAAAAIVVLAGRRAVPDPGSAPSATLPGLVMAQIATGFQLGRVLTCRRVTEGLMNPNWRMTTDTGSYAIKQLRDRPPATVRRNLSVLPMLTGQGLPVPRPLTTTSGDTLLRVGDDWYSVCEWLPGSHRQGHDLTLRGCAGLGELIGRLHDALASGLPKASPTLVDSPANAEQARARLEHFAAAAAGGPGDTFDDLVRAEVGRRLNLLEKIADQQPPQRETEPVGWTHGDLQPLNILIDPAAGETTAILDWDRLDIRGYATEVIRTATIWFTHPSTGALDLDRVAAFIRGYRARRPITDAQLLDAAHRRRWQLATETWQLRLHYENGDHGCGHLFFSDGRLLRWWLAHADAVNTALTTTVP
jgi:Ser/Thr protein kinase RdoA (MazF antagonist)